MTDILIESSWQNALGAEFSASYMVSVMAFLSAQKAQGKIIFPKRDEYFRALDLTPLPDVRVVILGQDPYHGTGQAHGLSFSVKPGVRVPPSLLNIYKELEQDLGIERPRHGFLEDWAKQGVLLLNSVLSVEESIAASHQGQGWETFTDAIIREINAQCENVVFMLWGNYAQKKAVFLDDRKHLILKAPHPSPLSAHRGFIGCGHFSKANTFLESKELEPINWQLPIDIKP